MTRTGLVVDPNTYDITILRGDDQTVRFTVTTSAGAAQDVTGWSFKFTVKSSLDDAIGSALFQKTTGGGGIALTTPLSGIVDVTLSAADTAAMAGNYYYDMQGTDTGGLIKTVREARFIVAKNVTTPGIALTPPTLGVIVIGKYIYQQDVVTSLWWKRWYSNGLAMEDGPSATIPF